MLPLLALMTLLAAPTPPDLPPSPAGGSQAPARAGEPARTAGREPGRPAAGAGGQVEIVRVARPGVPVIHFQVVILSGSADDPPGKEGLAAFTAELMRRGTRSLSREQIDDSLDQIAASLTARVQKEATVFSGVTLRRNLDEFYRIFSEVLRSPRFEAGEIEKLKADQMDAVEAVRQNDEALAREVFYQELYAGHPYGHLDAGTLSAIRSFMLEDVRGFHRRHYLRGNVIGGLAGDVDEALAGRLKADLESLPEGSVPRPERPPIELRGRRAVLVEKEGRTQTHFRAGHPIAVTRAHADYAALRVANSYLGQHRMTMGRLFQTAREQRGLSYGAYSYIEYFLGSGGPIKLSLPNLARRQQAFNLWVYPRSENTAFVLKLALGEMEAVARDGIPAERFADTREFVRNAFAFEIETPARELAMDLEDRVYGTRDFATRFADEVERLTPAQVREAARRHLRPSDLLIVAVVPEAEGFQRQLLSGEAPLIYPSGVDPGPLVADDARVRALDLALKPESIKVVQAAELFR